MVDTAISALLTDSSVRVKQNPSNGHVAVNIPGFCRIIGAIFI